MIPSNYDRITLNYKNVNYRDKVKRREKKIHTFDKMHAFFYLFYEILSVLVSYAWIDIVKIQNIFRFL